MNKGYILGSGLLVFLIGFIIMVVRVVVQHQYGALATFGAVLMIIGVFFYFYSLISSPKKTQKK